MAPSTATPSDLHRAPVACLKCRAAKVRCMVSRRPDRCDRCITNNTGCVFTQPKRARVRAKQSARRWARASTPQDHGRENSAQPTSPSRASPTPQVSTPANHEAPYTGRGQQPLVTAEIRARIVATLATLRGKRGAPFSFITSGDKPSFSERAEPECSTQQQHNAEDQVTELPQLSQPSLKLSWLLRPLRAGSPAQVNDGHRGHGPPVKMPSYASAMTLGQTISDPIECGIVTESASTAIFEHFMLEMNAKWEYVLDPHIDTHDNVRRRSALLFATVLFCSSKFVDCRDGNLVSTTDPFLQTRLCSLARNLAVRTFAEGDRSIETMQAFYLLVCWKDADDDVSYLHSGYAFRILHDLDLEHSDGDSRQTARRRRAWLALFRQDKQQSLFFMRRASLGLGDEEDSPFLLDLNTWLKMPHALPLDFVACCSADLRRIQQKLRAMVPKASSAMLPCISELLDSELRRWRSTWHGHFEGQGRLYLNDDASLDRRLLCPGKPHISALIGLWEQSVRLNVGSAILRQALIASATLNVRANDQPPSSSSLGLGFPAMGEALPPDTPGLADSMQGALGTLREFLRFPPDDLRRAPDSALLLGPNAALFLCLLLSLPCSGILGPSFQKTAIGLVRDVSQHVRKMIQSPQDTITLHAGYLDSLVNLLNPATSQRSPDLHETRASTLEAQHLNLDGTHRLLDDPEIQVAHVLASGMDVFNDTVDDNDALLGFSNESEQALHMQSLANLMDTSFFWEVPPLGVDSNRN